MKTLTMINQKMIEDMAYKNKLLYERLKRDVEFNGGRIASYLEIAFSGRGRGSTMSNNRGLFNPFVIIQLVIYVIIVLITLKVL